MVSTVLDFAGDLETAEDFTGERETAEDFTGDLIGDDLDVETDLEGDEDLSLVTGITLDGEEVADFLVKVPES